MQKKIELGDKYFKNLKLKCNINKSKVMVFKKGGKLKATEWWRMNGQTLKVGDKFNYLGVTLESTGGWIKEKTIAKTKVYKADGELVCNAKSMCGIEMYCTQKVREVPINTILRISFGIKDHVYYVVWENREVEAWLVARVLRLKGIRRN